MPAAASWGLSTAGLLSCGAWGLAPPTASALHDHLAHPRGLGALARAPHTGAAGGAACGDLIRVSVRVEGDRVAEAGFDAEGCAAARAAGSAAVELVEGAPVRDAALVTPEAIADELGGLVARRRMHAADAGRRRPAPRARPGRARRRGRAARRRRAARSWR